VFGVRARAGAGIRAKDFAASVPRPGGLIAAPLDPPLASLCPAKEEESRGDRHGRQ